LLVSKEFKALIRLTFIDTICMNNINKHVMAVVFMNFKNVSAWASKNSNHFL